MDDLYRNLWGLLDSPRPPGLDDPWDLWESYAEWSWELRGQPRPPLTDEEAYRMYHRRYPWAFDKYQQLTIYGSTEHGLGEGPDGSIIKRRWNPGGLARGLRVGRSARPDEIWQRRYTGEHYSLDVPIVHGFVAPPVMVAEGVQDHRHLGRFLAWKVRPLRRYDAIRPTTHIQPFATFLGDFWGILNLEIMVTDKAVHLLEMHLRPSAEFFPIYGRECVHSIFEFYAHQRIGILPGRSGAVLVEPHGTEPLDLVRNCWERSWRRRLHYLT